MSVVDKIQHYQRSIERCSGSEERMMHCISKLYRLPVTVQHLQETGVGRTVNALRKYEGDVGEAAKALVAKWKAMVADEDTSDGDEDDENGPPDPPEDYGYDTDPEKVENNVSNDRNESRHGNHESKERHRSKSEKTESSEPSEKSASSSAEHSKSKENQNRAQGDVSSEKQCKHARDEKEKRDSKHDKDKHDSKHDSKVDRKSKTHRDSKNDKHDAQREEKHKSRDKDRSNKFEDSRRETAKSFNKDDVNNSAEFHKKRKLESLTSEKEHQKKRRTVESDSDEDRPLSSEDGDKILSEASGESGSEDDQEEPKVKIKEEPRSPPSTKSRDNTPKVNNIKIESKSSKEKPKSSSSKSPVADGKHRHEKDKDKHKMEKLEEHRKSEKRKSEGHSSGKEGSKLKSHSSSSSSKDKMKEEKVRDKHKSKKDSKNDKESKENKDSFKEPKEKKKIKKEINGHEGIDCNSGASFAEALGMCVMPTHSRKRNSSSPSLSSMIRAVKIEPGSMPLSSPSPSTSTSNHKPLSKLKTEIPSCSDPNPPSLLAPNVKLEPLSVDLASTLPEISPNYKPLPYISHVHRKQEEDKALSEVIYAKNQRTKVYSGNKSVYTNVPSLYEICIRVLIENIEALEFTGGVPYDIIKPVLERATPDQLFMLEHHNPYLIEDTDSLWQFHCNREFRNKKREEMESWREMYMRCLDEREAKLKALTANIKQSIDKSLPVRSAKLAYVDNVVKPPRNVLRKQAKYGTARATPTSTSDLKKKLISGSGSTGATNISVPPPPIQRSKPSSSAVVKKTKAPLMAKALQLIKGRYKR